MNLGIGPQQLDAVKLPSQRCFGKHGMKLPMAGGAKFGLWTVVAAAGSWNQVVYRVPGSLPETQLALVGFRHGGPDRGWIGSFPSHPDWLRVLTLSIRIQKAPTGQVHPPLILF